MAQIKFFENRQDQIDDNINNGEYEVYRLEYTTTGAAKYIDRSGSAYITNQSQAQLN